MLFWNIWHCEDLFTVPIIYGKYGSGWQWPMLHNTLTVAEWANLWDWENQNVIMCIAVQNGHKKLFH